MEKRIIIVTVTIALLIVLGMGAIVLLSGGNHSAADEATVRAVVTTFGSKLQNVSLLGPASLAAQEMDENYESLVAPNLLMQWEENPSTAPGRLASSPWPASIAIDSVVPVGPQTYSVSGKVIEMTSTGESGSYTVSLIVQQTGGLWLIVSLTEQRPE